MVAADSNPEEPLPSEIRRPSLSGAGRSDVSHKVIDGSGKMTEARSAETQIRSNSEHFGGIRKLLQGGLTFAFMGESTPPVNHTVPSGFELGVVTEVGGKPDHIIAVLIARARKDQEADIWYTLDGTRPVPDISLKYDKHMRIKLEGEVGDVIHVTAIAAQGKAVISTAAVALKISRGPFSRSAQNLYIIVARLKTDAESLAVEVLLADEPVALNISNAETHTVQAELLHESQLDDQEIASEPEEVCGIK